MLIDIFVMIPSGGVVLFSLSFEMSQRDLHTYPKRRTVLDRSSAVTYGIMQPRTDRPNDNNTVTMS